MKYHIIKKSSNKKTGPIAVVTSPNSTCPNVCPFKGNGCYANYGKLKLHWDKVSNGERGIGFKELLVELKKLNNVRVRLWQAGDMPGENNKINFNEVKKLVASLKNVSAFGYTHKPYNNKNNYNAIKYCNDNHVAINLSANNLEHADELYDLNIAPVAVTIPSNFDKNIVTPKGRRVVVCPAAITDKIQCSNCGGDKGPLCYRIKRNYIIGFPAHGIKMKKVNELVKNGK